METTKWFRKNGKNGYWNVLGVKIEKKMEATTLLGAGLREGVPMGRGSNDHSPGRS